MLSQTKGMKKMVNMSSSQLARQVNTDIMHLTRQTKELRGITGDSPVMRPQSKGLRRGIAGHSPTNSKPDDSASFIVANKNVFGLHNQSHP